MEHEAKLSLRLTSRRLVIKLIKSIFQILSKVFNILVEFSNIQSQNNESINMAYIYIYIYIYIYREIVSLQSNDKLIHISFRHYPIEFVSIIFEGMAFHLWS